MHVIRGNIFTTKYQTVVNTINCVGVMGAGIAYEYRLRYPDMYKQYVELCSQKMIDIGKLWIYKDNNRWILNFPTKYHWKYPSKKEYLHLGLTKFIETYKNKGITSIAFPLLGVSNGGLDENESLDIMKSYLESCDIPVEIYLYDHMAYDDLFLSFKNLMLSMPEKTVAKKSGIRTNLIKKLKETLISENVRSLSGLLEIDGIGEKTLEKSFHFISNYKSTEEVLSFDKNEIAGINPRFHNKK